MEAAHTPPSKRYPPGDTRYLTRTEFTALYLKLNSGVQRAAEYLSRMGWSLQATRELLCNEFRNVM